MGSNREQRSAQLQTEILCKGPGPFVYFRIGQIEYVLVFILSGIICSLHYNSQSPLPSAAAKP